MTAEWPLESKRLEALREAIRYAKQRAVDLSHSDPDDAAEWLTVVSVIGAEVRTAGGAR